MLVICRHDIMRCMFQERILTAGEGAAEGSELEDLIIEQLVSSK